MTPSNGLVPAALARAASAAPADDPALAPAARSHGGATR